MIYISLQNKIIQTSQRFLRIVDKTVYKLTNMCITLSYLRIFQISELNNQGVRLLS